MNSPIGYSNNCGYCSEMGAIMLRLCYQRSQYGMSQKFLHHMNSMSKRDECMFSSRLHALHILSTVCVWAPVAGSTKLTECVVAITYPLQANVCPPLITVNDTTRFYETFGIVEWLHFSLVTFTWKLSPVICSVPPKIPKANDVNIPSPVILSSSELASINLNFDTLAADDCRVVNEILCTDVSGTNPLLCWLKSNYDK